MDDLANYVMAITNDVVQFDSSGKALLPMRTYGYTRTTPAGLQLTNGYVIIGLLSTPKYVPYTLAKGPGGYYSNHVVAYVRSLSGPASEKFPQGDASVQDLAFSYRLMPEVVNYGTFYAPALYTPGLGNVQPNGLPPPAALQGNLHELRLTFRWPLVDPKGKAGPSQQSFRCTIGGYLQPTNEAYRSDYSRYPGDPRTLYFFQPGTYVNTNSP
jgi:hypothetical protein